MHMLTSQPRRTQASLNAPCPARAAGAAWEPLPAAGWNARRARCRSHPAEPAGAGCGLLACAERSGPFRLLNVGGGVFKRHLARWSAARRLAPDMTPPSAISHAAPRVAVQGLSSGFAPNCQPTVFNDTLAHTWAEARYHAIRCR
jgi:hypothetical protein